jgi:hypothetical protein
MAIYERHSDLGIERWEVDLRVYSLFVDNALMLERPFTDAENHQADAVEHEPLRLFAFGRAISDPSAVALAEVLFRARAAYLSNQDYLAKVTDGTATNADHVAQVPRLTRQMQEVIRWIVRSDLLSEEG